MQSATKKFSTIPFGLSSFSVTLEYAFVALLIRQALVTANADSVWFALVSCIPQVTALLAVRFINVLSGDTWKTVAIRSVCICLTAYALAAYYQTPWAWLLVATILPFGQVPIASHGRLVQTNHHHDGQWIRKINAAARICAGVSRLSSFLLIMAVPVLWSQPVWGIVLVSGARILTALTFYAFAKSEAVPKQIVHSNGGMLGFPKLDRNVLFVIPLVIHFCNGMFYTLEADFFVHYAPPDKYPVARALQYLGIALSGLLLWNDNAARFIGSAHGLLHSVIASGVLLLVVAVCSLAPSWWFLVAFYGVISLVLTAGCGGADIYLSILDSKDRKATVAAQLFFRFVVTGLGGVVAYLAVLTSGVTLAMYIAAGIICVIGYLCFINLKDTQFRDIKNPKQTLIPDLVTNNVRPIEGFYGGTEAERKVVLGHLALKDWADGKHILVVEIMSDSVSVEHTIPTDVHGIYKLKASRAHVINALHKFILSDMTLSKWVILINEPNGLAGLNLKDQHWDRVHAVYIGCNEKVEQGVGLGVNWLSMTQLPFDVPNSAVGKQLIEQVCWGKKHLQAMPIADTLMLLEDPVLRDYASGILKNWVQIDDNARS